MAGHGARAGTTIARERHERTSQGKSHGSPKNVHHRRRSRRTLDRLLRARQRLGCHDRRAQHRARRGVYGVATRPVHDRRVHPLAHRRAFRADLRGAPDRPAGRGPAAQAVRDDPERPRRLERHRRIGPRGATPGSPKPGAGRRRGDRPAHRGRDARRRPLAGGRPAARAQHFARPPAIAVGDARPDRHARPLPGGAQRLGRRADHQPRPARGADPHRARRGTRTVRADDPRISRARVAVAPVRRHGPVSRRAGRTLPGARRRGAARLDRRGDPRRA